MALSMTEASKAAVRSLLEAGFSSKSSKVDGIEVLSTANVKGSDGKLAFKIEFKIDWQIFLNLLIACKQLQEPGSSDAAELLKDLVQIDSNGILHCRAAGKSIEECLDPDAQIALKTLLKGGSL
jgi:hypothetical protein